ncbi:MAG: 50S ribosomal protein L10 [Bacilli bacterium]
MANKKIIEGKSQVVSEIEAKIKDSASVVLFEYRNLTVSETDELRKELRKIDSEFKIYKNTLTKRALENLNINLDEHMNGPKAIAFGKDVIAPIKALSEFSKAHKALEVKVGIVDGAVADSNMLSSLAAIPSREGLLTMLAGGLIGVVRDLSICLDLYSQEK